MQDWVFRLGINVSQALKDQAKFNQLSSNNFRQCLPFCSDSAESRSFNPPKLWANLVEAGLHLLNKTAQLCKRNTNQQRQQKSHAGACFTQWKISKFLLFKNTAYHSGTWTENNLKLNSHPT